MPDRRRHWCIPADGKEVPQLRRPQCRFHHKQTHSLQTGTHQPPSRQNRNAARMPDMPNKWHPQGKAHPFPSQAHCPARPPSATPSRKHPMPQPHIRKHSRNAPAERHTTNPQTSPAKGQPNGTPRRTGLQDAQEQTQRHRQKMPQPVRQRPQHRKHAR